MAKTKEVGFLVIILLSFVFAESFPEPENLYVNDFANVLSEEQNTLLINLFTEITKQTTAEVVFVSVASCAPYSPSEYALKIGENWGVGKVDIDNGVVALYCLEENKFWIATGYGVEGILPDSKIGRFLDETYVPQRDLGNVSQGIIDFSIKLSDEMFFYKEELISNEAGGGEFKFPAEFVLFFFLLFFYEIFNFSKNYKKAKNKKVYSTKASVKFLPYVLSLVLLLIGIAVSTIFFSFVILFFITSRLGVGRGGGFIWMAPRGGGFGGGLGGGFGGGGFGGGGMGR